MLLQPSPDFSRRPPTLDESLRESSCEIMDKLFRDEPVVLVDAFAWIFRAYYALPDFRNDAGVVK